MAGSVGPEARMGSNLWGWECDREVAGGGKMGQRTEARANRCEPVILVSQGERFAQMRVPSWNLGTARRQEFRLLVPGVRLYPSDGWWCRFISQMESRRGSGRKVVSGGDIGAVREVFPPTERPRVVSHRGKGPCGLRWN